MKDVGYPLAVTIAYGPNHKTATKLLVSIFKKRGQREQAVMEKWFVESGDVRHDAGVQDAVASFIKQHHVAKTIAYGGVYGCPHEEKIDYPLGGTCPHCPFWANVDRQTLEPISLERPLSAEQILAGLACQRDTQPVKCYAAAESHRENLIEPFLQAVEHALNNPAGATPEEATLFSYAQAFLAKWREPRLYPLLIRWLSLPDEGAFDIGGDTVSEWGPQLLAMVCGGDLEPIKQLIVNRDANESCRWAAIDSLAFLVAWNVRPQEEIAEYFGWLAREGLEREPGVVWDGLAISCMNIEAVSVFDELRRACQEDLISPICVAPEDLTEVAAEPRGRQIALLRDEYPPIEDMVEATKWWSDFKKKQPAFTEEFAESGFMADADGDLIQKPFVAPPKVGRNDPCPCGSGKKYKKCCGA